MPQGWEDEWEALARSRDAAVERSRRIQEEITAFFRRRQAPPMQLMRAAEAADRDLAAIRAQLRDFLRQIGAVRS